MQTVEVYQWNFYVKHLIFLLKPEHCLINIVPTYYQETTRANGKPIYPATG